MKKENIKRGERKWMKITRCTRRKEEKESEQERQRRKQKGERRNEE